MAGAFNPPDYLVTWNDRQEGRRCPSFDDVELGMAHAAGGDAHKDFALTRNGIGELTKAQRGGIFVQ
jgi:hypothetical protein